MATMTVEQGKCQIYPDKQEQMCVRVQVLVWPLRPTADPKGEWVVNPTEDTPLKKVTVSCSQRGLERLLKGIDNATKAPTPRPREAKSDA